MKLAIFKVNQLGDNVVFLPVVQALRALYPQWDLLLLTSPVAAELYLGDLEPSRMLVTPTAEFNGAWRRPSELLRLATRIRREHCNASFLSYDQGNVAHLLARFVGGRVRVGRKADFIKVPGGLTDIVSLQPGLSMAQTNWEMARILVERLGGASWPASPPPPNLRHLFGNAIPREGRIVIHPGASLPYQRWFPERYEALANRLAERFEVLWIEQTHFAGRGLSPAVRRVAPKSLAEFITTLRTASLMIGNNSGPMHLASALGCPSVIISGPSNPVWDPMWYRERFIVLRDTELGCLPCDGPARPVLTCHNAASPLACMARWSIQEVYERSCKWIANWRGSCHDSANPRESL